MRDPEEKSPIEPFKREPYIAIDDHGLITRGEVDEDEE